MAVQGTPGGVMPYSLCTAFSETRQCVQIQVQYHNDTTEPSQLTDIEESVQARTEAERHSRDWLSSSSGWNGRRSASYRFCSTTRVRVRTTPPAIRRRAGTGLLSGQLDLHRDRIASQNARQERYGTRGAISESGMALGPAVRSIRDGPFTGLRTSLVTSCAARRPFWRGCRWSGCGNVLCGHTGNPNMVMLWAPNALAVLVPLGCPAGG